MSEPWKCPECGTWLAPRVPEHRCDPPGTAGVVTQILPPGPAGSTGTSISTATLPGTITVNVTGSLVSQQDLADRVQSMMLQRASQNWTLPGRAA
jgi:hypothetical protein